METSTGQGRIPDRVTTCHKHKNILEVMKRRMFRRFGSVKFTVKSSSLHVRSISSRVTLEFLSVNSIAHRQLFVTHSALLINNFNVYESEDMKSI
jgi:predicted nucleic acid-binding OB-fold protein